MAIAQLIKSDFRISKIRYRQIYILFTLKRHWYL